MGFIFKPGAESFEFEWVNLDYPGIDMGITSVALRLMRYNGTTLEYLQAGGATWSAADYSVPLVAQDAAKLRWRFTDYPIQPTIQGVNVIVEATPNNADDVGRMGFEFMAGVLINQQEYTIVFQGGLADSMHHHTGSGGGGGVGSNTRPVVQAGASVSPAAWEAPIYDPQLRDQTLAGIVAPNLAAQFAPEKSIIIMDRRSPEAFPLPANYTLTGVSAAIDGTYPIVKKEPVQLPNGSTATRLHLGRLRTTSFNDQASLEGRVGKLEHLAS